MGFARRLLPLLAVVLACGDGATGPQPVASVDVSPTAITLAAGQATSLAGTPRDATGKALTDRTVSWASDNASVATVDASGRVQGLVAGNATITATAEGVDGSATVTVQPPPASTVAVTPSVVAILPGDTLRLSAVARDAQDNILTGGSFTWVSNDVRVATVDASGLVTGHAPGSATLFATRGGASGNAEVGVVDPNAARILSVDPAEMIEGQPATLRGVNFDPNPAANIVTIDGVRATVTAASDTTVALVVPSLGCRPTHLADIAAVVAGNTARFAHPARPASYFQLATGQLALLQNPAAYCLLFDETPAEEEYLFGVQVTSASATNVASVLVVSDADDGVPSAAVSTAAFYEPAANTSGPELPATLAWRAREAEIMSREIDAARELQRAGAGPALAPPALAIVPGTSAVGDTVTLRYPVLESGNTCTNYVDVHGTVRYVGATSIWVSDDENPPDGYSASHYQTLGDQFENTIYPTQVGYFGAPADTDANGHIVIVVTKEVNDDGIGGIVPSADLFARGVCAASNEGEYFYMLTADPSGTFGLGALSIPVALSASTSIVGHEFVHNVHISRRFAAGNALWESWMHEGQATLGEEVLGHAINARSPAQNYGWEIVRNQPISADRAWYYDNIRPLFLYYGWSPASGYDPTAPGSTKRANAPEGCTWLDGPSGSNAGLCAQRGLLVYGVTWSFLRWLSDHYGPGFPGGESAMHRAWIDGPLSGFASLEALVGEPIEDLLARWAASLYLDDRGVAGLDPLLTFPSYDLGDVEANVVPEARLTPHVRSFADFQQNVQVRAGSSAYFLVSGANRPSTAIRMRSATGGFLDPSVQVWVVRTR
jgi:hypothetical protein